jgi:aspartokinase/homoserine dehydrogenase 1
VNLLSIIITVTFLLVLLSFGSSNITILKSKINKVQSSNISSMQVLKFGGSSVASSDNIKKVVAVVKEKLKDDVTVLVVSAFGGITDLLLNCGTLAASGNDAYKQLLKESLTRHLNTIEDLGITTGLESITEYVTKEFNDIQDICHGIYLLKEFSPVTKDRIVSYGELLSSKIVTAKCVSENIQAEWKDARELIVTDDNHTNASVDFNQTEQNIKQYFSSISNQLVVVPDLLQLQVMVRPQHLAEVDLIILQPLFLQLQKHQNLRYGLMLRA